MKALLNKQTEKAVNVSFKCELYGETFTVKSAWLPKSQIEIKSIGEDGVMEFDPKNDWILDAKTRDYCKFVADNFANVKSEVRTYLSPINNVKVDWVWWS